MITSRPRCQNNCRHSKWFKWTGLNTWCGTGVRICITTVSHCTMNSEYCIESKKRKKKKTDSQSLIKAMFFVTNSCQRNLQLQLNFILIWIKLQLQTLTFSQIYALLFHFKLPIWFSTYHMYCISQPIRCTFFSPPKNVT